MKTYDWIVIGGGITGAALSYELSCKGFTVVLLDQNATLQGATRYSYGGLGVWSSTSELMRLLSQEGMEIHRSLSEELEADTQLRELDLLLTIDSNCDPQSVLAEYSQFETPPKLISAKQASELEPLLNQEAISGALITRYGHIHPGKTTQGYKEAFRRAGGEIQIASVLELLRVGDKIQGVTTKESTYFAANTVVCAGGISRALLKATGIDVRLYFTHAEMIEIPPVEFKLQTIVMPAQTKRFQLEAKASTAELDYLWNEPGHELVPPILDAGAIQFLDGSLRIGQISRVLTDPQATIAPEQSETAIRAEVGKVLPTLEKLSGTWHSCLVAFSNNSLPVVGKLGNYEGAYVFSGFTKPMLLVPTLAKRFTNWISGQKDSIIPQLSPIS
ncbi:MAG: FAD-binding oxidoreductase [Symploca sp. SIO3C6]|uniref:FAD-binding oxidoreductase n=1 Tax=Symploca sp. SIO1C4 TaxID=2607765 RepID=A0A6B3N978_9CYAN|nr:FAD-binding oxidoreductase [Symploca sp. SIO3C6]NER28207.1 FAD-binding oxidoreductase [Symploca sp. SIO1C4]NET03208.1 FAD-binding oxidoreductase [Symploca sp. SIO2B6]